MSETNQTATPQPTNASSSPSTGKQPVAAAAPAKIEGTPEVKVPDKLGHQLHAERRLKRQAAERQAAAAKQEATARELLSKVEEIKSLPPGERAKRIAEIVGTEPNQFIKDEIAALTNQQAQELRIDDKTDPNIKLLAEQNRKANEELARLRKEREEEKKAQSEAEAKRQQEAQLGQKRATCGEASKAAWEAETNPVVKTLFDNEQHFASEVWNYVRNLVDQQLAENPEWAKSPTVHDEIIDALKTAPPIVLKEQLAKYRARVGDAKYNRLLQALTESDDPKPKGILRGNLRPKEKESGKNPEPVQMSSSFNHRAALKRAQESIPENATFLGLGGSKRE